MVLGRLLTVKHCAFNPGQSLYRRPRLQTSENLTRAVKYYQMVMDTITNFEGYIHTLVMDTITSF